MMVDSMITEPIMTTIQVENESWEEAAEGRERGILGHTIFKTVENKNVLLLRRYDGMPRNGI